jgi:hypothetical protein
MRKSKALDEMIDWMVESIPTEKLINFKATEKTSRRVEELIFKEKNETLSPEEKSELDHYMTLEHVFRVAKSLARKKLQAA